MCVNPKRQQKYLDLFFATNDCGEDWGGQPRLVLTFQCSTSTFKDSWGWTTLGEPETKETTEHIHRLVGKTTVTSGLHLKRPKVLRSLRLYLWGTKPQTPHHRQPGGERGIQRRSTWWSPSKRWMRAIISQMNGGTVSQETLGKLLTDETECIRRLF